MFYDLITKTVSGFLNLYNPVKAIQYAQKRELFKCYSERRYNAAKKSGSDSAWQPSGGSGANINNRDWRAVTEKTRDLARNNPHIVGAKRRFRATIISEGIWPRPKILKRSANSKFDFQKPLIENILSRWEYWAPSGCANGDSVYQAQRVAANHFFDDGQVLIRRVYAKEFPFLRLEVLECDHLDSGKDHTADANNVRTVGGIKLDEFNKPIGYWIRPLHPDDHFTESIFEPAKNIIHLFDRQRASDVTGISGYASVVENFFRINEYSYSTMYAERLSNHFGIWIESPYVNEFGEYITNTDGGEAIDEDTAKSRYSHISPAALHFGLPGEKPHQMKPENPGSQYDPFLTREIQTASVGAGISYEAVSHDGSRTNFAGSRMLELLERSYCRMAQSIFEEQLHSTVYRWFMEAEITFGNLLIPDFEKDNARYLRVKFNRPVREWVDPHKDMRARELAIKLNLTTETDEAEEKGRDIEEIYATKKYENEMKEKMGINQEFKIERSIGSGE